MEENREIQIGEHRATTDLCSACMRLSVLILHHSASSRAGAESIYSVIAIDEEFESVVGDVGGDDRRVNRLSFDDSSCFEVGGAYGLSDCHSGAVGAGCYGPGCCGKDA